MRWPTVLALALGGQAADACSLKRTVDSTSFFHGVQGQLVAMTAASLGMLVVSASIGKPSTRYWLPGAFATAMLLMQPSLLHDVYVGDCGLGSLSIQGAWLLVALSLLAHRAFLRRPTF